MNTISRPTLEQTKSCSREEENVLKTFLVLSPHQPHSVTEYLCVTFPWVITQSARRPPQRQRVPVLQTNYGSPVFLFRLLVSSYSL